MTIVLFLSLCGDIDSTSPAAAEIRPSARSPLRGFEKHPFRAGMTLAQVEAICARMNLNSGSFCAGCGYLYCTTVLEYEVHLYWDVSLRVKSIEKAKMIFPKGSPQSR